MAGGDATRSERREEHWDKAVGKILDIGGGRVGEVNMISKMEQ